MTQIEGTGSEMIRPMSVINSVVNADRSFEGADLIQSKSSPFEKNFGSDDEVTSAAGPLEASISSITELISLTRFVFQRFSPLSSVRWNTSSSFVNLIILQCIEFLVHASQVICQIQIAT